MPIATCHPADAGASMREGAGASLAQAFRDALAGADGDRFAPSEARVLLIDIRQWLHVLPMAAALLDPTEAARVARKRFARDRQLLTLAYAMHRLWLARTLHCEPADVPLVRDGNGCPQVPGTRLNTSLSHSASAVAIALTGTGVIGVDIEPASRAKGLLDLASRICHPNELTALNAMPEPAREAALLRLWVRKEALLKALGVGLRWEMSGFEATGDRPSDVINNIECNLQLADFTGLTYLVSAVATAPDAPLQWSWLTPGNAAKR